MRDQTEDEQCWSILTSEADDDTIYVDAKTLDGENIKISNAPQSEWKAELIFYHKFVPISFPSRTFPVLFCVTLIKLQLWLLSISLYWQWLENQNYQLQPVKCIWVIWFHHQLTWENGVYFYKFTWKFYHVAFCEVFGAEPHVVYWTDTSDRTKGPYADHILIPQGATGSSAAFGVKWKPIFFSL